MSTSESMGNQSSIKVPRLGLPSLTLAQLPLPRCVRWQPDPHEAWSLVKGKWHATPPSRFLPVPKVTPFKHGNRAKASASLSQAASQSLRTGLSSPTLVPSENVEVLPAQVTPNTSLQPTPFHGAAELHRWASVNTKNKP